MVGYFASWTFRFRGKSRRLVALAECFLDDPGRGLSAPHIGRATGIGLYETARMLNDTPELFVKLPRRADGITRYRLASSVAARGRDGIADFIAGNARRESWIFYLLMTSALLVALVVLLAFVPQVL